MTSRRVPIGMYDVVLHFAEIFWGVAIAGEREFDIFIENNLEYDNVNIVELANHEALNAMALSSEVMVIDGSLSISFELSGTGCCDLPFVSGVQILAGDSNRLPPPSVLFSPAPTASPTHHPTASPTPQPTGQPTKTPSSTPTNSPTFPPTMQPTTLHPTGIPTANPTFMPTGYPTAEPTSVPSPSPTADLLIGCYNAGGSGACNDFDLMTFQSDLFRALDFMDSSGQVWLSDSSILVNNEGTVYSDSSAVINGTDDPGLYQVHRFGIFRYEIP